MIADNSVHLLTAAARRSTETRERAAEALRHLDASGTQITFAAVADEAGVSRSWLYRDPDICAEIQRLRDANQESAQSRMPAAERATEPSLRRRLETLLGDNRALRDENNKLREQIATLLGNQRAERVTTRASASTIGPCS
ncbi:MAG: transposase [Actinobacteria bacterium]|nr:transposase [Actinomycetota bacterium]